MSSKKIALEIVQREWLQCKASHKGMVLTIISIIRQSLKSPFEDSYQASIKILAVVNVTNMRAWALMIRMR